MLSIINLKFLNRVQSFILFFLLILLLFVLLISFSLGSYSFPVLSILMGNTSAIETTIFSEIRVPRVILAAIVGIKVTEIKTEIKTETDIAIPISLNNWPIGRSSNKIGIKTTTVVSAEPRMGAQTCLEPL